MTVATIRPWLCFSSSSGETFEKVWLHLSPEARANLKGFFTDRPCGAALRARNCAREVPVYELNKAEFEARVLEWCNQNLFSNGIILLCGFFGILSESFLRACPSPIVNTHPSLLPSFPGLDQKVHKRAYDAVTLSGFTVHLVTEALDGGPILFQHPVSLAGCENAEESRDRVRVAEQKWLPRIFEKILQTELAPEDRVLTSSELRKRYDLNLKSFGEELL